MIVFSTKLGLASRGMMVLLTATSMAANSDLAQDNKKAPAPAEGVDRADRLFIVENELAISKMSLSMSVGSTGDVDRDFVALMLPHHQDAIDIACIELRYGRNEALRQLAQDIISERRNELSLMKDAVGRAIPDETGDQSIAPGAARDLSGGCE